jgi:streptomycin 6-kinase
MSDAVFAPWLARWDLVPDGEPIATHSSRLLPVRRAGAAAMLKVALEAEERLGGALMAWWDGDGAARVLAHDGDAILLERAEGTRSLAAMARGGEDGAATRILCAAVARLHARRGEPLPELVPLTHWFRELAPAAATHGRMLAVAATTAEALLASPRDVRVLHGDIHHDNVLDFGPRGWLAIDPKGLLGEGAFDYANLFCNPDLATATDPVRFTRRVEVVCAEARLERRRLLQWIVAWCGLSAAWWIGDGKPAEIDFAVAELALAAMTG